MVTSPPNPPLPLRAIKLFGRSRRVWLAALLVVIALCIVFSWITRDAMGNLSFLKSGSWMRGASQQKYVVDQSPWLTAQALSPLAMSREEKEDARAAEHLADHDVDQAFAAALRKAEMQTPTLTPEAKALTERVKQGETLVQQDQAKIASMQASATSGKNSVTSDAQSDDVDVAKAQLGLDSDELSDAQEDLARAVGDDRARIQQELAAHEAVMQKYDNQALDLGQSAVISTKRNSSLAHRISAWFDQRTRRQLLLQAEQEAQSLAASLTATRNTLESGQDLQMPQEAAASANSENPSAASRLALIKSRIAQRQLLTIYADRILTEQQLAGVYAKWAAQVSLQHRILLHLMAQSIELIAFILLCQLFLDVLISYWTARPGLDQRRRHTLRMILRVALQIISIGLILVVIFGKPQQISTILGLATAGLTVALQSYILAFCGWFVLMGKNGMQVGDSVEINGVAGEVTEIGLFRTMLLETGNWTAKGHPTGRLVGFMNTFAVTGQYFNFSTVGQWMWDEITVSVPTSVETYHMIETIHRAVSKETDADAKSAEAEWKRASHGNALSQLSALPTVDLRPAASGVDVIVRYVTRAADRTETRNNLYQAVLNVLNKPKDSSSPNTTKSTG